MENKDTKNAYVRQVADQKYEYGFTTDVHTDIIEKGLNEDIVRLISEKKGEPDWMLEFRLKAFRHWQKLEQPTWGHVQKKTNKGPGCKGSRLGAVCAVDADVSKRNG